MSDVRVEAFEAMREGTPYRVECGATPVVAVRIGEEVFALHDRCSHADFALSDGMVWMNNCTIECPKHGASFSLQTGEACSLPATRPVPTVRTEIRDGDVWVVLEPDEQSEQ